MAAKPQTRKKLGAEPKRPQKPPVSGWIWLATGAALGAFVMFLTHLTQLPVRPQHKPAPPESTPAATVATQEDSSQKPRYDFYRLLKENQSAPPEAPAAATSTTTTPPTKDTNAYLLQVASYKTADEAEALRAKLLLINLNARVEKVTLRNTEIWHRVLIGPIKNQTEMSKIRGQLSDNRYDALVLKSTP
jgi:cell division protein FtsN